MSDLFKLNLFDLLKGLIVSVFTAVLVMISDAIKLGSFSFDWVSIWQTAVTAGVAYLLKQFLTNNQGELLK
jgi:hypothetical protein